MHLAVVSVPVAGVACAELFTEDLVLAVGAQHQIAAGGAVSAGALVDEPFILFPPGYEVRERALQLCRGAGFEPRVVLDGAEIEAGAVVRGSIIGPRARVGQDAIVRGLTVLGAEAIIGEGNVLDQGLRVNPGVVLQPRSLNF